MDFDNKGKEYTGRIIKEGGGEKSELWKEGNRTEGEKEMEERETRREEGREINKGENGK